MIAIRRQKFAHVVGGMFALARCREREYNLFSAGGGPAFGGQFFQVFFNSPHQFFFPNGTLTGENQHAAEHEVAAAIGSRTFNCCKILVFFYKHEKRIVACLVRAIVANDRDSPIIKTQTVGTLTNFFSERRNELGEFFAFVSGGSQKVVHKSFTLPGTDTGKASERTSKFFNVVHTIQNPRVIFEFFILKLLCELAEVRGIDGLEGGALLIEVEFGFSRGAVPVLLNENFGDVRSVTLGITFVLAMNKHHDVRILFNGTGVAQVAQTRFAAASLHRARELRERNNRHLEFSREAFQRSGYFGHLLDERVGCFGRGRRHKLQIIDDDEPYTAFALQPPRDGAHRKDIIARFVINIDGCFGERFKRVAEAAEIFDILRWAGAEFPRIDEGFRGINVSLEPLAKAPIY